MSHNITTTGPIAQYNNPPINPQYFKPSAFQISAISRGQTTTVTTTEDHNYVVGQLCRLLIPDQYGSRGLNEAQGMVISIPADDQVTLNIYSVGVNAFVSNPSYGPTEPQILAIGDYNSGIITSTGRSNSTTNVPGAFINISPL